MGSSSIDVAPTMATTSGTSSQAGGPTTGDAGQVGGPNVKCTIRSVMGRPVERDIKCKLLSVMGQG